MMRLAVVLAVLCAGVFFSGCTAPWKIAQANIENSKSLRVGMTKAEVLKIMGEPLKDEVFCKPDIWYYYTDVVWGDGMITEDECLPLVFKDSKLIGWGKVFLADHRLRRADNTEPKTGPKEKK